MIKEIEKLKNELQTCQKAHFKHFLKQGSFSLYHCKEMDNFIKKAYDIVLNECFKDFLPLNDNIPFCILASKSYAKTTLCANEALPLLFVYKDIKAYNIKPIIKALIGILNDLAIRIEYSIIELDGLKNIAKNELKTSIIQTRFICGSKILFKGAKECFSEVLKDKKEHFANELLEELNLASLPFLKQEFNIKKDFGGLDSLRALSDLLFLYKDSPKHYALNFIDEKNLAQLRLNSDFLLSLKSAMDIMANKEEDIFSLNNAQEIADLMNKKNKKNLNAKEVLIQKALQSMHNVAFYCIFLSEKIQNKFKLCKLNEDKIKPKNFKHLLEALQFLASLRDENLKFDIEFVYVMKNLELEKDDLEKALMIFKKILQRKYSFEILKLMLDSNAFKELCKPYASTRFLSDEEGDFSLDIQALLCIKELENSKNSLSNLSNDEFAMIKFVILFSALRVENEVSAAGIWRAYMSRFDFSNELIELGLRLYKNYDALKDLVEKEDIFNPLIIATLLSRVENSKTLEILYELSLIKANALNAHTFFYKGLNRLIDNARQGFEDENLLDETARRVKKELTLKRSKIFLEQNELMQDKITHIKSNLFIIKNSFEDIINIAKIARENEFKFWFSNESNLNLQVVAKQGFNFEILLLALSNLNLIFMNLFELFDDKIYLKFEYENIISDEQKANLINLLNSNLQAPFKKKPSKAVIRKDEIKLDLNYAKNYAKLSLNTKDQQGLIAFLMGHFNSFNLSLLAAKIQTIRQRTRNTFIFQKNEALLQNAKELIKTLISE